MEKNFDLLFAAIQAGLHTKNRVNIAIDGPCASGKTSLAQTIQERFGARILPMDDFFLPRELRTEERYRVPGGNVHYERFLLEVASCIDPKNPPSEVFYRPFDCKQMAYKQLRSLPFQPLSVVEGTYSLHSSLQYLYDIKILLTVSKEEQEQRLLQREGRSGLEIFKSRWIPMETLYFSSAKLESICDFIV